MNIYEQRRAIATFIRKTEYLDGRYIPKMNETDKDVIRKEYAKLADNGIVINFQERTTSSTKFTLVGAKEHLAVTEELIHKADKLQTCPALDEYNELIEKMVDVKRRLADEYGSACAVSDAKMLGLTRAVLNF